MRRKKSKFTTAEILNRTISQWEHRQDLATKMLHKSADMLLKLRRQRRRMLERLTTVESKAADDLVASTIETPVVEQPKSAEPGPAIAEEDIPDFLERTGKEKDAAARQEIEAEQAALKKRKAERRIEKLKIGQETKEAELTGKRRKMPLTGKEALAAIRG